MAGENENTPIDLIPNATSTAGAMLLGTDNTGKTRQFPISTIQNASKGKALSTTNPGIAIIGDYYDAIGGITYTNFKDLSNNPITIPADVSGKKVLSAKLVAIDATHWTAVFTPVSIDMMGYAKADVVGGKSLINGYFADGFSLGGPGSGNWQGTGGTLVQSGANMRVSHSAIQGLINWTPIPVGSYTLEIIAKVVTIGDGKFGAQINGSDKFLDLINDGQFHSYKFEYISTEPTTNLILWNQQSGASAAQTIDLQEVRIYDNTLGIVGTLNQLIKDGAKYNIPADIYHSIDYGQSLSRGATGQGITNNVISPNILMFRDDPLLAIGPLVPLFIPITQAEVPGFGGAASALKELADSRGFDFGKSKLLFSYAGEGSQSIAQLSKGSAYYTRLINHVSRGLAEAQSMGLSYCLGNVFWTQGEADYIGTSISTYSTALIQLRNDVNADVKAITGQKNDVNFIMYQPSSFNSKQVSPGDYNKPFVTLYEEIGLNVPGFYFGNPNYDKVYTIEDSGNTILHLNSISYKRMGAEYGVIVDKLLTGQPYERLKIIEHSFQGKLINLQFNKDVAIDITTVAQATNYGFTIGAGNTINNVSVKDSRVTITCANNIASGTYLGYAFNASGNAGREFGPRGNIRSTEVRKFSFATIYDWLAHSQITL